MEIGWKNSVTFIFEKEPYWSNLIAGNNFVAPVLQKRKRIITQKRKRSDETIVANIPFHNPFKKQKELNVCLLTQFNFRKFSFPSLLTISLTSKHVRKKKYLRSLILRLTPRLWPKIHFPDWHISSNNTLKFYDQTVYSPVCICKLLPARFPTKAPGTNKFNEHLPVLIP